MRFISAVKCNDMQIVLEVLAALGASFDCASKVEINKVLDLGVSPKSVSIIFDSNNLNVSFNQI